MILDMLNGQPFWQYLNFTQKNLLKQSFYLLNWAENHKKKLHDYSFIVMPAAKAFEGFLKQFLFDLNLISEKKFNDDYFRIGKTINPELEHIKSLRRECLHNEITQKCGKDLALLLWQTWKRCRNRLFHYFPKEQQLFTLKEAEDRLNQIVKAMNSAFKQCKV
ncbi:hypothetical protein ACFLZ1_00735 [Patescibacteria group bacterium]